jgi:hypothetical protein
MMNIFATVVPYQDAPLNAMKDAGEYYPTGKRLSISVLVSFYYRTLFYMLGKFIYSKKNLFEIIFQSHIFLLKTHYK